MILGENMDSTDSEKDLKVNPDELLEKCSDWTMSVNSTGLSSMNVGSTFSSFIILDLLLISIHNTIYK